MIGFRKSHAVVIGIDQYGQGIPSLRTAVHDASRIAQVLETGYGYTVRLLTADVSLANLRVVFDESLPREIEADDRLLVYFAGHGIALDGDDGPAGYLVPQDAARQDKGSFLAMTEVNRWLDRLPCRHLLLVLDCCFAGAYRWSSTRELGALPAVLHRERFDRYIRDPAWQVITSAAYDQKALDVVAGEILGSRGYEHTTAGHSPFAMAFLRALELGEADLIPRGAPGKRGGNGVITATELYLYLRECVEAGAEADGHLQTPGLWPLKKHDKGEYIHLVPGHELNLPPAPALDEANNPWRGLQSYDEEHAQVFFGRSRFVEALALRVRAQPLTVVLGASGTGKSSVVKAGLLPALRTTKPAVWQILPPIRPGKSPLASLAGLSLPGEQAADLNFHVAEFRINPEALAKRVGAWAERAPDCGLLLLVIDQFEELITLCWDAGERNQLMKLLQRALGAYPTRLRVVLTLRSDFEPQFARSPLEGDWMSSRVVVPALTLDEYRETIEGPASVKVLYFKGRSTSQEFVNRLIGDVANTPGALPLLSFTLSELYRRYLQHGGDDRAVWEQDYETLGGVGGSLRNRADEVYDKLPDDAHRGTMRKVMLRMISVDGGEIARRHVPDDELVYDETSENQRREEIIRRLTDARLVVKGKEADDQPYVEPAHDELVRGWDKLLTWSREESEGLQLRRRLAPAAQAWERGQAGTWATDPRLRVLHQILRSPHDWLNAVETRFVRRSWFWRRAGQTLVAGSLVVLSVITLWALYEQGRAREQTAIAVQREKTATSRQLAALSATERSKGLDRSLLLAVEALKFDNTSEARAGLFNALEDRPGIRTFLHTEEGTVNSVAFSRDGKTIAVGYNVGDRGGVVLWDVATRKRRPGQRLAVEEGGVSSVAFDCDGKTIAAGYDVTTSGGVVLWDVATGERLAQESLAVKEGGVNSVAFGPDGKIIAAGYGGRGGGGVVLWRAATRERLAQQPLAVKEGGVNSVTFDPGGMTIAAGYGGWTASAYGGVVLWDAATRERLAQQPLVVKEGLVKSVAFRPDGKTIAAGYNVRGSGVSGVVLWDVASRKRRAEQPLPVKEGNVQSVAFRPDGKAIAAGYGGLFDRAGGVVLWGVDEPKRMADEPLTLGEGAVLSVAFSPDGETVAAGYGTILGGTEAGVVALWDVAARKRLTGEPLAVKDGGVNSVAFSRDGKTIAAGYSLLGSGGMVVWDVASRKRLAEEQLKVKEGFVESVLQSPDGKIIAAGYGNALGKSDAGVVVRPVARAERSVPAPVSVSEGAVRSVSFSPDGKTIAAGYGIVGDDLGGVVLWDVATRRRLAKEPLEVKEGGVSSVIFAPDGKTIAAGYGKGVDVMVGGVVLWEVAGLKRLAAEPLAVKEGGVSSVAFSPNSKTIAAGYGILGVGGVVLWDATNLKRLVAEPLVVKEGTVNSVAFSPDGGAIAAGYMGGVLVWDIATRKRLTDEPLVLKECSVNSVAFRSDGKVVAAGYNGDGNDGGVVLWDVDLDSWQRIAGRVANRNFSWDEWRQYFPDALYRRTFPDLPDGRGVAEAHQARQPTSSAPLPKAGTDKTSR